MTRVTGRRMSLNLLAGVRPQSKVECLLGSGPKVKSRATVLWRQTQGAALWSKTRGAARKLRVREEKGGWLRMGRGEPLSFLFFFGIIFGGFKKSAYLCSYETIKYVQSTESKIFL